MKITSTGRASVVWWGLVAAALLGTGCELITAPDRSLIPGAGGSGGTGGSSGGTGGTVATGATGGTTTTGECTVANDCPDPGNECQVRACVDQKCVPAPVADGTMVAEQTAGDCKVVVCDGAGATKTNDDDADVHADGVECTSDICTNGTPSNPPVTAGTACGAGGALYCDDAGKCVGCLTGDQCGAPTDCATPTCNQGTCEAGFTAPGTPVPMQTAGDCLEVQCNGIGGTKSVALDSDVIDDGNPCTLDVCAGGAATHPNTPSGVACADGGIKCNGSGACVACLTGADCASLVCTGQTCIAPTCMDGVKNASETDKDCGGADCAACANGKGCSVTGDCTSKVCTGSVCQVPTCVDTTKNGTESDVDCGGATCPKCGPNLACTQNSDCKGGSCVGNTCVPTCTDTVKNGTESDVDCGGSCAAKCGTAKACGVNADCTSGVCTGFLCQAPACNDSTKNGTETDVDCGGSCATKCADLKQCTGNADCQSGKCTGNVCQVPTCNDSVKNASETDVDCGGGTCPTCTDGKVCVGNGDCAGGSCLGGFCGASTCVDMAKNGQETGVDCGGPTCPACALGEPCNLPTDCASGFCTANLCVAPPNDNEPANNTCAGAVPALSLPANINNLQLPALTDVDWFQFTADAADVGKVVHVQTTSAGVPNPCDTVVEVFAGASCAALTSLGGESDDQNYSENWLSTAIPSAGPIWVKVSYSSFGFSSAPYTLLVSLQ